MIKQVNTVPPQEGYEQDKPIALYTGKEIDDKVQSVTDSINEEVTRATFAETFISGALAQESADAREAEKTLDKYIKDNVQKLNDSIKAEETRATFAETFLQGVIAQESADTNAKITVIKNDLENESLRAKNVELSLSTSIIEETDRSVNEDANLTVELQGLTTEVQTEVARLDTAITAEEARAIKANEDLLLACSEAINAEGQRAAQAEGVLDNKVTNEENRAKGAELFLDEKVTDLFGGLSQKIVDVGVQSKEELDKEITRAKKAENDLVATITDKITTHDKVDVTAHTFDLGSPSESDVVPTGNKALRDSIRGIIGNIKWAIQEIKKLVTTHTTDYYCEVGSSFARDTPIKFSRRGNVLTISGVLLCNITITVEGLRNEYTLVRNIDTKYRNSIGYQPHFLITAGSSRFGVYNMVYLNDNTLRLWVYNGQEILSGEQIGINFSCLL